MTPSIIHTIWLAGAFLVLFASAELLYHKLRVKAELTRKYVHLATGLLTMLFPVLIDNHWLVLALCGSFLLILLTSLRFGLLPSINAVDRVTRGSILYPIIVYGCYLLFQQYNHLIFYYIPILILAFCDPIAALVGKSYPVGKYTIFGNQKTALGSFAFFLAACLTSCIALSFFETGITTGLFGVAIIISVLTTIAEGLSNKGYDNLTIPGTAVLVLVLTAEYTDLL